MFSLITFDPDGPTSFIKVTNVVIIITLCVLVYEM